MMKTWLTYSERKPCPYLFHLIEIAEKQSPDSGIKDYLSKEIISSYRNLDYLKRRYEKRPQAELREYIQKNVLAARDNQISKNVSQGDFGEILASLIVSHFCQLEVPLMKLRWKFNKDRSTFCTDLISHNQGDNITEVHYYEVKTRLKIKKETVNGSSNHITVNAHNALLKDQQASNEGIADFLSRLYYAMGDYGKSDMYGDLVLASQNHKKCYELFVIINKPNYIVQILDDLNNLPPTLAPLCVTVVLIQDLGKIVIEAQKLAINGAIKYVYG